MLQQKTFLADHREQEEGQNILVPVTLSPTAARLMAIITHNFGISLKEYNWESCIRRSKHIGSKDPERVSYVIF